MPGSERQMCDDAFLSTAKVSTSLIVVFVLCLVSRDSLPHLLSNLICSFFVGCASFFVASDGARKKSKKGVIALQLTSRKNNRHFTFSFVLVFLVISTLHPHNATSDPLPVTTTINPSLPFFTLLQKTRLTDNMADMMYFMGQNKKKEETKKKEREEKAKLKDVNMCKASFDTAILNEQHQRDLASKEKVRAQPKENAKFDMANALFGGAKNDEEE